MTWTLSPRSRPALRVDLRGLSPVAMAQAAPAEVERLPVGHGSGSRSTHCSMPSAEGCRP